MQQRFERNISSETRKVVLRGLFTKNIFEIFGKFRSNKCWYIKRTYLDHTAQKMKLSIKDFFSKYDQIRIGHIYWINP